MARTKPPKKTVVTAKGEVSKTKTINRSTTRPRGITKTKLKKSVQPRAAAEPQHQTLFFWDPSDPISGFLSPWYNASFELDDVVYQSVGHYIMAAKARYFKDTEMLDKILASKSSDEQKILGNNVKGFKHELWYFGTIFHPLAIPSHD